MAEYIWTIIKFIIGLVLVVIIAYLLFWGPGKQLLINLGLLGGLPKQAELSNDNSFNKMIANIERCKTMTETDCLCEVFPSWPGTFARDSKITIAELPDKITQISLSYRDKIYKNTTMADIKINGMIVPDKLVTAYTIKKELDWRSEPAIFLQEGYKKTMPWGKDYRIVSSSLYKGSLPDTLFLLVSNMPQDKLSELNPFLSSIKKCSK